MSKIGVWLVERINELVPPPAHIVELHRAKLRTKAYQRWEEDEAQRVTTEFGTHWDPAGKAILDIGCGLGGKLAYYANTGASSVHAVDLRLTSVRNAHALARDRGLTNVYPLAADGAHLPYADETFDIIVSVNVFEHVDDLPSVLTECNRILRSKGRLFLHFPPFYSPWGAHLEGWINFPWPHVFFSDKTLLEAARRIEAHKHLNKNYINTAQVDWTKLEKLPELNRVTIAQFYRILKTVRLRVIAAKMLPFGRHFLLEKGKAGVLGLAVLRHLAKWPILREIITTKMVFIMEKE